MADDRDFQEEQQATVNYEADRSELIARLCECHPEIPAEHVEKIVKSYGPALAWLLHQSSNKRVEIKGSVIFTATPVDEETGIDPNGNEYTEEAHYRVDTKFHKGFLDELGLLLNRKCKN